MPDFTPFRRDLLRSRRTLAVGAAVLAAGVAGCGGSSSPQANTGAKPANPSTPEQAPPGDIPDNQAYVAYRVPQGGFSVKVPEGWARTAKAGATTFSDKLNSVTMEAVAAKVALTTAEATRTEVPKLAKATPGFANPKVTSVVRTAGPAIRITYLASGPADSVTGKSPVQAVERYVFFHAGRDVVLTLKGAKAADNTDPWKIVTNSLRYTR